MHFRNVLMIAVIAIALLLAVPGSIDAQRGQAQAPQTAKAAAAIDLTGYWVSVVTEDWKFRMVTPGKGEYGGVPITAEGRKVADGWDPAKDEAAGNQCKAYGAAAIMRMPGHFRISWENDTTLRVETDSGTQTRLLHFAGAKPAPGAEPTWQGHSAAQWQAAGAARGGSRGGTLKVVTTQMRPGYLRKNGVPYSGNAIVTEYYDRHEAPGGEQWLVVTTAVDDPLYVNSPYLTSTNLRKVPDGLGWNPTPCSAK